METTRAYEEIINLIASPPNSQRIVSFEPSDSTKERVRSLINREKEGALSREEKEELDSYLQLEHIMRLAKARARQLLSS